MTQVHLSTVPLAIVVSHLLVKLTLGTEATFTTQRHSQGYILQYKAQTTCRIARLFPSCDSYQTCITDNKERLQFQLEVLHTYIYWMMHDFHTLNVPLECNAANLPAANSVYKTLLPVIGQKTPMYQHSTLIINYIYNLADVLNYIYYGHTWVESSNYLVETFTGASPISSLDNLHNMTTLGVCGDINSTTALTSIFATLTSTSSFNQSQKYSNTLMSYCTLCEFCHTVRHYYKLVAGESMRSSCGCTSQLPRHESGHNSI